MGFFSNLLDPGHIITKVREKTDPLAGSGIDKTLEKVPGSPSALFAGMREEKSGNPYGSERSAFDIAGGGTKLSQSPTARTIGRTVGSAFAGYYAAGALAGSGGSTGFAASTASTAPDIYASSVPWYQQIWNAIATPQNISFAAQEIYRRMNPPEPFTFNFLPRGNGYVAENNLMPPDKKPEWLPDPKKLQPDFAPLILLVIGLIAVFFLFRR